MTKDRPVTVFACGEPLRGDDGLAAAAVALLPSRVRAEAEVRCLPELRIEDLVELAPEARVVVVDAVVGPTPGTLCRLELRELSAHATEVRAASTHQLPLAGVVELASLLDRPHEGVFLGLAGGSFEAGAGLSPAVVAALPILESAVRTEIERLAAT